MTKAAWVMEADGWEVLRRRDGSVDYRKMMSDRGRPNYSGSAKRYAVVYVIGIGENAGKAMLRNSSGYMRLYSTVEEAKGEAR